ncbi:hypothetical protein TNIN_395931 [Trichonephila inaurata madagascariensis]|uniref:Uncharacterized protein n=1 Tax=Trichonephila inaurata madagascariensis TaxID=2747483 RepID=A0A8X7C3P1_9ARAC|nr:hypothetical protein TNIN_395931 [Trichonephila inaurata madagascariensis]
MPIGAKCWESDCDATETSDLSCLIVDVDWALTFSRKWSTLYRTERTAANLSGQSLYRRYKTRKRIHDFKLTYCAHTPCFVDVGNCCSRRMSKPEIVLNRHSHAVLLYYVQCFHR